ncbi:hypothetical protein [Staphylococcus epidermidis]|uniref:hypothetical protein n=1 Tax=Staphylococcus epidermidis TaxID=1282 RepID=UPI0002E10CE3|nr:hypothetical protein [Staphylococcus epidermidis]MBC3169701.1 hypothetical protein [Staphylococcus epidermidis]MCG7816990.1 hypothetical protein [Staphylococcus epidermidis]MCO6347016.1 hypothetical protein [Staphylococcus epidermidis]
MNIKKHWLPIVVVILVVVIFLLVTFARVNEGLDNYEQHELNNGEQQYLSKGAS